MSWSIHWQFERKQYLWLEKCGTRFIINHLLGGNNNVKNQLNTLMLENGSKKWIILKPVSLHLIKYLQICFDLSCIWTTDYSELLNENCCFNFRGPEHTATFVTYLLPKDPNRRLTVLLQSCGIKCVTQHANYKIML